MSKVLLHFQTALGARTVVAEIGDTATAQAVVNAHLALGERAAVVEEMPRLSLKDLMAKHRRSKPVKTDNVTTFPSWVRT